MDQLIRHVGLPMALRVLGLLMLVTGLPAAWVFKERLPIAQRSFVEWYAIPSKHTCTSAS